jgi:hypothetical protein
MIDRARINPAQTLTPDVGIFVGGEKGRRAVILLDLEAMKDGRIRDDYDALDDALLGFFYMGWEEEGIAPEDVYIGQKAVAKHGWGPLLYEIAMAVAVKDRTQGLSPDRKQLSKEAQAVWERFYQRDDIQRAPFTEGRLWNQPHLDQIYSSKLRFNRNLGNTRAMLKRIFGRLDEAETILWEYGEAWFQSEFDGGDWSQRRNPGGRWLLGPSDGLPDLTVADSSCDVCGEPLPLQQGRGAPRKRHSHCLSAHQEKKRTEHAKKREILLEKARLACQKRNLSIMEGRVPQEKLQEIADKLGLSLLAVKKACFTEEIKELCSDESLTIGEIANRTGFSFSKILALCPERPSEQDPRYHVLPGSPLAKKYREKYAAQNAAIKAEEREILLEKARLACQKRNLSIMEGRVSQGRLQKIADKLGLSLLAVKKACFTEEIKELCSDESLPTGEIANRAGLNLSTIKKLCPERRRASGKKFPSRSRKKRKKRRPLARKSRSGERKKKAKPQKKKAKPQVNKPSSRVEIHDGKQPPKPRGSHAWWLLQPPSTNPMRPRKNRLKQLAGKFSSADEFDAANLKGYGAKSVSDIAGIIDAASRTRLDLSLVRQEVAKGGQWYFLHKITVADVDPLTHGEVTPTGKEDLSKPIVVGANRAVLDGRHRVMLAKKSGIEELPAYIPARLLYQIWYDSPMMRRNPAECTDTGEEIMDDDSGQCAGCYLEGQDGPCQTWTHYLENPSESHCGECGSGYQQGYCPVCDWDYESEDDYFEDQAEQNPAAWASHMTGPPTELTGPATSLNTSMTEHFLGPMRRNPTGTLRTKQNYGPCRELGEFAGETAKSMSYIDPDTGKKRRIAKKRKPAFAGETAPSPHVEPCDRCLDHPESRHGPGYCIHGTKGFCESCMSMRRNPWDGRSGICPVCARNQIGCGNCAPCIDRGGYARGCTVQLCQECYNEPGDMRRNPGTLEELAARRDLEDAFPSNYKHFNREIRTCPDCSSQKLTRKRGHHERYLGACNDCGLNWTEPEWPPEWGPRENPAKECYICETRGKMPWVVQGAKGRGITFYLCDECKNQDPRAKGWHYEREDDGEWGCDCVTCKSERRRFGQAMPRSEPENMEPYSMRNPSGDTWHCDGPMAGNCGIAHKSEETALRCCAKNQRATGHWRHPHRIDCKSLIRGTAYICSCGAFERARERLQPKPGYLPFCEECQLFIGDEHWPAAKLRRHASDPSGALNYRCANHPEKSLEWRAPVGHLDDPGVSYGLWDYERSRMKNVAKVKVQCEECGYLEITKKDDPNDSCQNCGGANTVLGDYQGSRRRNPSFDSYSMAELAKAVGRRIPGSRVNRGGSLDVGGGNFALFSNFTGAGAAPPGKAYIAMHQEGGHLEPDILIGSIEDALRVIGEYSSQENPYSRRNPDVPNFDWLWGRNTAQRNPICPSHLCSDGGGYCTCPGACRLHDCTCPHCGACAKDIKAHRCSCSCRRNPAAYSLDLTEEDISTIAFVGGRYSWSDALRGMEEGHNEIEEHEAWEIRDAFDEDTKGGHSMFPMLAGDSKLYDKLLNFWQEIV